ncbi:MAG: CoA transferase, partial [Acidimicrobiales bacterium]
MTGPPLGGFRILDCTTGTPGAVAGMFLADFGADVVRIETSAGAAGRSDPGTAAWDRGKRSVAATSTGPAAASPEAAALGRQADAVLLDGPAGALAGTAFDLDRARATPPGPVLVHLGPFTAEAPWAGGANSEALAWAASGLGMRQASYDGGPVEMIVPCLSVIQGAWGAAVAVAALRERLASGRGQVVSVAGVHAAGVAGAAAFTFDASAPESVRTGPRIGGPGGPIPFYRPYRCADGEWLFLAALTPHFSRRAFAVLGKADLTDDPRLGGGGRAAILRPENAGWVIEEMAAVFAGRPRQDWLDALAAAGCPAGPLLNREDWLDHPQVAAIGMRAELEDPQRGRVVMPGVALNLTASPARVAGPAPTPGSCPPDVWPDRRDGPGGAVGQHPPPGPGGPLGGVRVLDLGAIIAGPFAGSLLGELGAEVVKIEPPAGDSFRG